MTDQIATLIAALAQAQKRADDSEGRFNAWHKEAMESDTQIGRLREQIVALEAAVEGGRADVRHWREVLEARDKEANEYAAQLTKLEAELAAKSEQECPPASSPDAWDDKRHEMGPWESRCTRCDFQRVQPYGSLAPVAPLPTYPGFARVSPASTNPTHSDAQGEGR